MRSTSFLAAVSVVTPFALASEVFVHYMAQGLSGDQASQDVQKALALGIDAFALNVGEPDADWCKSAVQQLFDAADGTDFSIFFSLDLYAEPDPNAFTTLINDYTSHPNYFVAGADSAPMLSTFLDAGWSPDQWTDYLGSLDGSIYFVPMFDQSEGYYSDPEGFWTTWKDTLDGSFSWEQAWPGRSDTHANVTSDKDEEIIGIAHDKSKTYMMSLSSLQYKHFQGEHWFRAGDTVFPERMAQILSLPEKPEFIQIQTWNDAGESHYIGPLWEGGLTPEILEYSNQEEHSHEGWQSLVASFVEAFKSGVDASGMRPQNGAILAGAMWHHEFLTTSECKDDSLGQPEGHGAAIDAVNWAVVLGDDASGYSIQVSSGGETISTDALSPGLNYKSVPNVKVGEQIVQVVDGSGTVVAEGGKDTKGIAQDAPGLCNYNFQVAEVVVSEGYVVATSASVPEPTAYSSVEATSVEPTTTEASEPSETTAEPSTMSSAEPSTTSSAESSTEPATAELTTTETTATETSAPLSTFSTTSSVTTKESASVTARESGTTSATIPTTLRISTISSTSISTATSVTTTSSSIGSSLPTAEPGHMCHGHRPGHGGHRKRHHHGA